MAREMVKERLNDIFSSLAIDIKYRDVAAEDLFICNKTDTPLTNMHGKNKEITS